MIEIEDYDRLSPEAKKYYLEHDDYFDGMAEKWGGFIDMPTVIETSCKGKEKLPKKYEDDGSEPN